MKIDTSGKVWNFWYASDTEGYDECYCFEATGDYVNSDLYESSKEVAEYIASELAERGYIVNDDEMREIEFATSSHFDYLDKEILPGIGTEEGIRHMLKLNTNMTDREIDRHIEDGCMVYDSFEEAVNALTDAGESREEAEDDVNRHFDKMEYDGHTYYVDFTL